MKFLAKLKLKQAIPSILKTVGKVADNIALGGVVTNAIEDTAENPKGKVNVNKLIVTITSATIPVILLVALLCGVIDVEQLKELLKLF